MKISISSFIINQELDTVSDEFKVSFDITNHFDNCDCCVLGTTSVPVVTIPAKVTTKPSNTGNTVNEAICGTRGRSLAHPVMDPQHIVGGSQALPGDWPWQVGIASLGSNFIYCGGTLISDQWVVGAAHCFSAKSLPSRITARLGDHNSARNEGKVSKFAVKTASWYHFNGRGANLGVRMERGVRKCQ